MLHLVFERAHPLLSLLVAGMFAAAGTAAIAQNVSPEEQEKADGKSTTPNAATDTSKAATDTPNAATDPKQSDSSTAKADYTAAKAKVGPVAPARATSSLNH